MEGYVYILVNSSLPNLVKVGYTTKSPTERASELSSTGVPNKFIVAYSVFVSDCVEVERLIHDLLKDCRHNQDREFFEIDSTTAIDKLLLVSQSWKTNSSKNRYSLDERTTTLYMAKIANYSDVYRIGLVKGSEDFLKTDDFRSSLKELYAQYDVDMILGDINVIYSEEFEEIDEVTWKQMNLHINNLLRSEKNKNTINYIKPEKYDERTLNFRVFNERTTSHFFEKISQSIQPFALTSQAKILKEKSEVLVNDKLKIIQSIKNLGY